MVPPNGSMTRRGLRNRDEREREHPVLRTKSAKDYRFHQDTKGDARCPSLFCDNRVFAIDEIGGCLASPFP
jgi:hypothetical protein